MLCGKLALYRYLGLSEVGWRAQTQRRMHGYVPYTARKTTGITSCGCTTTCGWAMVTRREPPWRALTAQVLRHRSQGECGPRWAKQAGTVHTYYGLEHIACHDVRVTVGPRRPSFGASATCTVVLSLPPARYQGRALAASLSYARQYHRGRAISSRAPTSCHRLPCTKDAPAKAALTLATIPASGPVTPKPAEFYARRHLRPLPSPPPQPAVPPHYVRYTFAITGVPLAIGVKTQLLRPLPWPFAPCPQRIPPITFTPPPLRPGPPLGPYTRAARAP